MPPPYNQARTPLAPPSKVVTNYAMTDTIPPQFPSWSASAAQLIDVAAGRAPADMVIFNARWVNVHTREVLPDATLAIKAGRFAYAGFEPHETFTGPDTTLIDAKDRFAIPGLCDGHMHIESGMLTVSEFSRAVMPHGTTTMFVDPHEVANVLGMPGIRHMHDEALTQPINVYVQMPSCAPSAPGLETTGAELGPADVAEAMTWPNIIGLGEMMNFPGVIHKDPKMLGEMAATQAAGKTIGGHYASPDLGLPFNAYAAGGPADDHEGTREEDAIARVRQGMRAMLRLGSAWYDVESQITAVTEKGLDPRGFILCTDDCHSGTLVNDGHMNRVVRHAIDCGLDPLIALQMATINTATHFGLERELGSIAPGRRADVILTSDLKTLPIAINLGKTLTGTDFEIKAKGPKARARIIGVVENQAPTQALEADITVTNGIAQTDEAQDIAQIALVERHRGTGGVTNAFVSGFGYKGRIAMASTVAHDSHHMIVVGTCRESMALAANRLGEIGGGVTVFQDAKETALIPLPIAGLISDQPASEVAAAADKMIAAMAAGGCTLNNAYMQHSLLALVVIPELRISDLGLIDVTTFQKTDLFVKDPI